MSLTKLIKMRLNKKEVFAVWQYNYSDELQHYGVVGMKWGVRRASKHLSKATTTEQRDKAISKLNKHRTKATKKIEKLNKRGVKLQRDHDENIRTTNVRAAELKRNAALTRNKAYGRFTSQKKASQRLFKANKKDAKADALIAAANRTKAYLDKNSSLIKAFEKGISDIDSALIAKGKRYVS